MGLVGSMGMTDNMMLKSYGKGHSPIVDRKAPLALAETDQERAGASSRPDLNTPVSPPVGRQRPEGAGGP